MGSLHFDHNFGVGRPLCGLNSAGAKLAFSEIERDPLTVC
jgi:hypothetical protein